MLCVTMCCLCAVFLMVQPGTAQALERHNIIIAVSTDKNVYYLGETVELTILIRNVSNEAIDLIEPAIDRRSLNIEVVDPKGLSERMLAIYGLNLEKVRLAPKRRVRFNTSFTPEQLGKFIVNVAYHGYQDKVLVAEPKNVFIVQKNK